MSTDVSPDVSPDVSRPSARIIPFPAGGRRALAKDRAPMQPASETHILQVSPQVAPQVSFGAWYHDEAIRDSKHAS